MNSKRNSMPSLEEAIEELRSLLPTLTYDPAATSEELARQAAFNAGQVWALDKLIFINNKYKKGDG